LVEQEEVSSGFYPNPADKVLTISLPMTTGSSILFRLVSSIGMTTLSENFDNSVRTREIDVSQVTSGIYFAVVSDGGKILEKGVVVITQH
jgi:hypothetical protein